MNHVYIVAMLQDKASWSDSSFSLQSSGFQQPDVLLQQFQPELSRQVTNIERYNELLGLQLSNLPDQARHPVPSNRSIRALTCLWLVCLLS